MYCAANNNHPVYSLGTLGGTAPTTSRNSCAFSLGLQPELRHTTDIRVSDNRVSDALGRKSRT